MVEINFISSKGVLTKAEGLVGETIMECAQKNDIYEIEAECGGGCTCATCHVYIQKEWLDKLEKPTEMEEDMLDFAFEPKPGQSRLTCQLRVSDDLDGLIVRMPERQI